MELLSISIIIPTLNSGKTLKKCLDSILIQDYPKEKLEIIIADGGSVDNTISIVESKLSDINYKICSNPLKTGEAGKAVGIKNAKNDLIAFIDSDNILPQKKWFKLITAPFKDPEIVSSEPIYYTYRITDGYITRYCALLGMNDPICLFLGNYDRFCTLTGVWTEAPRTEKDMGIYIKVKLANPNKIPTIGANGFLIRREVLQKYQRGDYFFDIDIIYDLVKAEKYAVSKVKIGIIHLYCRTLVQLLKKQRRRIKDYTYYNNLNLRKYPWSNLSKIKIVKFCFYTVTVVPILLQALVGYLKRKDNAWFFHIVACWLTLLVYGYNTVVSKILNISKESREEWQR